MIKTVEMLIHPVSTEDLVNLAALIHNRADAIYDADNHEITYPQFQVMQEIALLIVEFCKGK